jgi:hypothetical protein
LHELGTATLRIQVFIAEDQQSNPLGATLGGDPERSRMTDMKKSCRRGRKATTIPPEGIVK